MMPSTYIAASKIHGKGLFARDPIEAGQIIGWLEGKSTTRDGPHVLWISANDGIEVHCHLKYINHSDYPNACYYDDLSVVALRAIAVGEEITHDYNSNDW